MRIKKNIIDFLGKELSTQTIDDVWMKILKTHIQQYSQTHNKEDFSTHKDFNKYETYSTDILESLSLVEISMIYEFSLATVDKHNRKQTGSYYTPEDIADFMAKKSEFFEKGKVWLDPCSGIGNLSYHLAKVQEDPENFVLNNLLLQDINKLALKIAHVLFALHFQNNVPNFYEKIEKNFIHKDFLKDYEKSKQENALFSREDDDNNDESNINKNSSQKFLNTVHYDYIIVNPPYLSAKKNDNFITSSCRDLYGYFLEKIVLSSEGFISITPQSFTNSSKFESLRNLLTNNMNDVTIYAFDNIPDSIFKGYKYGSDNTNTANSVRAAITVAVKHNLTTGANKHRITPLLRWRTSERAIAIEQFDNQLVNVDLSLSNNFPKLHKGTVKFYYDIVENLSLSDLVVKNETDYSLIVPSTPRYFITASKALLNRSSFHQLFFKDEKDLNIAYLLLNSSYMYWWWRVNDGGMTLSLETLLSLPLLNNLMDSSKTSQNGRADSFENLVEQLEDSEKTNRVVKVNAGKSNENIKHPFSLVEKITRNIVDDETVVESLLRTHLNSFVD